MTPSKTYGVGILGLGVMGRRMAGRLRQHPRFSVAAAYDPQASIGGLERADSPQSLVNDPRVDCLYIASPPAHHAAGVALASRARKPVLCEKPLAPTIAEAEAMCAQVKAAGKPGGVNFYLATGPAAVRMRRLVANGALGEIREARLTLRFKAWPRPWQSAAGAWLSSGNEGGFTREVGSHFLFQAGRMFGPGRCVETQSVRGPAGSELSVIARVEYPTVTLLIDGAIGGDVDEYNRFDVIGTKGRAALVDWDDLDYAGSAPEAHSATPDHLDELANLLDGKPSELATFAEGAAVVGLTEAILG
jgi:predicted dehydrogenase